MCRNIKSHHNTTPTVKLHLNIISLVYFRASHFPITWQLLDVEPDIYIYMYIFFYFILFYLFIDFFFFWGGGGGGGWWW